MKKLRVTVNGVTYDVEVELLEDDEEVDSYGFAATNIQNIAPPPTAPSSGSAPAPAAPRPSPATGGDSNVLTSPIPGVIKEVKVKVGDAVQENDPLVVIEAMKMDTIISSPVEGKIKEVQVQAGENVQQGQTLITFA